jgi:hypothetical protein
MTHDELFDIAIPIELRNGVAFEGRALGNAGVNNEQAFKIENWAAELHCLEDYQYIVVRTICNEQEAREAVHKVLTMLPAVSVVLDAGIRAATERIVICQERLNLNAISLFSAAGSALAYRTSGQMTISVGIATLSQAFKTTFPPANNCEMACEIFADVDFETSATSKLVLLATVLELLCERAPRDNEGLLLIEKWMEDASAARRKDLVTGLQLMREQSISAAIRDRIMRAAQASGLDKEEEEQLKHRAKELYRRRSAIVHGGQPVSYSEVVELRSIVRFLLIGSRDPGVFSPAQKILDDDHDE